MGATKKLSDPKFMGGVVGGIAGTVVACLVVNGTISSWIGRNSVERQIERMVSETSKQLPMQVDAMTRWDRIEAGPGKSYSYIYTIDRQLTDPEKDAVREDVTRRALATPDLQATFAAGITIWYRYHDPSGQKVFEFAVSKQN